MTKEKFYFVCGVLGLLFGLGIVGNMDYQDQQNAAKAYCDGVRENVHPDYNKNFNKLCVDK